MNLLSARRNVYSQNGEDGVIEAIFDTIGVQTRWCCEFGAWDGIHFSNTRALVELGWSAVLLEWDSTRYKALVANTAGNPRVRTFNWLVDAEALERALAQVSAPQLDLLVVDIDGLDFEVLQRLAIRPRVICVEINAGHPPEETALLPRQIAQGNVGQPFGAFHALMTERGYQLVAYCGNAFYVTIHSRMPCLSPAEAYDAYLEIIPVRERRWLYHVNRGEVEPFHRFGNERLSRRSLGLGRSYIGARLRLRMLRHLSRGLRAHGRLTCR